MKLFYPYEIQINTTEEAIYFIKNKCKECERQIYCNGNDANKCNNIVKQIMEEFNYGKI